eukprot:TRINITY_DN5067_c0_g1_i1.p2 TRINITY_DN5067_c0_g1~~TRINITY_DN5067_c0_g1_i1.p2  ORF type:complete len:169 (-),score=61.10 TRINITY_DN5067_c0_g1_i1:26-475(-)
MESVLQRTMQRMELEHMRVCERFREELQRLHTRCSELQAALLLQAADAEGRARAAERTRLEAELLRFCERHARGGAVPVDALLRWVRGPQANAASPDRKRARDGEPAERAAKRPFMPLPTPPFGCNFAAHRNHEQQAKGNVLPLPVQQC